jgi:MoxR-like ATPase
MSELLTIKQWDSEMKAFCQFHRWVGYSKTMANAPGWLRLIADCVNEIEAVLQPAGISPVSFFAINVVTDNGDDTNLSLYIDFKNGETSARETLCQDLVKRTMRTAQTVCHKCGQKLMRGNFDAVCDAHREFNGVFAEDYAHWLRTKPASENEQTLDFSSADEPQSSETNSSPAESKWNTEKNAPPVITGPNIKLYDLEALKSLKDAKNNDSDVNRKRKELAKKMESLGDRRAFCPVPDANAMATSLRTAFPNFGEVIDFIESYVLLAKLTGKLVLPPILLKGEPGIGKTAFTGALAEQLGTDYVEVHMENEQSNSTLAGSSEFWANSQPGVIFEALVFGKTCNPLIVVDEVDKASKRMDYNPMSPLYQLLERDTATRFSDLGMRSVTLDASKIMWILTANEVTEIDPPILSRMTVFDVLPPSPEQAKTIAQRIYTKVLARQEWERIFAATLTDEVATRLADFSPRRMQSEIEAALGRVTKAGRRALLPDDIVDFENTNRKQKIGFV